MLQDNQKLMRKIYYFVFDVFQLDFSQANKRIKVLFLGNSYTYVNNLPSSYTTLLLANGDTLVFDSNRPGGHTFNNHFNNATSISKINSQALG